MLTPTVLPAPYSTPPRPARAPATQATGAGKKAAQSGAGARRCAWCGCKLRGHHLVTHNASCRSQLSRFKRRACAATLVTALGLPKPKAEELIKRFGLPEVEARLNALGWYWHAPDRAWERENAQPYREVA